MSTGFSFPVSGIYFPQIYKPAPLMEPSTPGREIFSCGFPLKDCPQDLVQFAHGRMRDDGLPTLGFTRSSYRPIVVAEHRDNSTLETTLRCADAANISRDRLFDGVRADLAVELEEFDTYTRGIGRRCVQRIRLLAVRVNVQVLINRYDEICAQYFTGG